MLITKDDRATPRKPGQRLALLICNGIFPKIEGFALAGVAKDAKQVEAALSNPETCRFAVRSLVDRGLLEVRREIARICRETTVNDTLLIYYSGGHRKEDDGSLYLLVNDSESEFLGATALDAEFILSQLRGSACRKIVLLVDTCNAGALFNNNRGIPDGLYAITSCGADEVCADTAEGGAFSLALCAGLQSLSADDDGDGRISIDELHEFIKQRLSTGPFTGMTPQKWVWNVPEPIYVADVPRHVFLSYSRKDQLEALKLKTAIEAEGLAVWIDLEGIESGDWKKRVTDSLNRSRALVMLLTANSLHLESPVNKELAFAAKKNVPVIPVHLGLLQSGSLPEWFIFDYGDVHRHQLDIEGYEVGVKKLVKAIRKLRKTHRKPETGEVAEAKVTVAEGGIADSHGVCQGQVTSSS
jgi:hypothetical protein